MKKRSKIWLIAVLSVIVSAGIVAAFIFEGNNKSNDAAVATSGQVGLSIGDLAPDFSIQTIDKQTLSLASLRGEKALVITTLASWCPTCIFEADQFAPVYPRFKDSVGFLSVSIDPIDDRLELEAFRVNTHTPWFYTHPNLSGVRDMILAYRFDRFEITYIIDKDGVIRFKDRDITSTETLQAELEKLEGNALKKERGV